MIRPATPCDGAAAVFLYGILQNQGATELPFRDFRAILYPRDEQNWLVAGSYDRT